MKAIVHDQETLSALVPSAVESYLQSHGWKQVSEQPDQWSVWTLQDPDGEDLEITLPLRSSIGDYALRMGDVLSVLSVAENRSQLEVLEDLQPSCEEGKDECTVTYSLSVDDALALARYQFQRLGTRERFPIPWFWVLLGGVIVFLFFQTKHNLLSGPFTFDHLLVAFLVGGLCGASVLLFHFMRPRSRSSIEQEIRSFQDAPWLRESRTLIISEDGITSETSLRSTFIRWQGLEDLTCLDSHLFFFEDSATAHVVPRHAFAQEEDWHQFVELAQCLFSAARSSREKHSSPMTDTRIQVARSRRARASIVPGERQAKS